ncbi:MAG: right-handed parallel beta-helix repeat-containing protein [Phycisphaerales bacterium]|nr:MAG: right-handed parallel beta-helix repeat-containing protein [Phycisphaerales bacterium]
MKTTLLTLLIVISIVVGSESALLASQSLDDPSPKRSEQQLSKAMHSLMEELPHVTVGRGGAELIGDDNRALQAAVDYIAGLGGGTVAIRPGQYLMYDSLHLRTNVTVVGARGTAGKTILKKADGAVSVLTLDGDFGEQQITVADPNGFAVGHGVAIWDDRSGGFHTTVARITGRNGNTFSIDKPLMADCMVSRNAKAGTVFPVVSGYNIEGARIENVIIEGNKESNVHLNGCRGAGIFLYRAFGTVIQGCEVRNYNGDGISFQQSNDVIVRSCICQGNAFLGIHPGSGSQRPDVNNCIARNNGTDGLFLCWRVRHGKFEYNTLEGNGRYGISIGHKDSDNSIYRNQIIGNHGDGIFFRNETLPMAAHRNRLEENIIENNGIEEEVAGIRIRGQTNDLELKGNTIRDTREGESQKQTVGIKIEEKVGRITISGNNIQAKRLIDDQRKPKLEQSQVERKTDDN